MLEIVYTPSWFYGHDIIIDIVSLLVLVWIGIFSFRFYNLDKKNNSYLYHGISFFILGISFLFKILMNFTIHSRTIQTKQLGLMTLTFHSIQSYDTLFFLGFLVYRIMTLIGLYILCSVYIKNQPRQSKFLIIFLLFISTIFSQSSYYIFHITAFALLIFIAHHFINNYLDKRTMASALIMLSFIIIAISQVISIFIKLDLMLYVVAEIIQLLGYALLLAAFVKVIKDGKNKDGKKKKQD